MVAAQYANSPDIVEALLQKKADANARNEVSHLEDSRCAACILIAHSCVFVAGPLHSSAVRYVQILPFPGHRGGLGEGEGGRERDKQGEAFGG